MIKIKNDTLLPIGNIMVISKPKWSTSILVAKTQASAGPTDQPPPDRAVVVRVGPGERLISKDEARRVPIVDGADNPIVPGTVIYCEFGMSSPIEGSDHLYLLPSPALLATAPGLVATPITDDAGVETGEYIITDPSDGSVEEKVEVLEPVDAPRPFGKKLVMP